MESATNLDCCSLCVSDKRSFDTFDNYEPNSIIRFYENQTLIPLDKIQVYLGHIDLMTIIPDYVFKISSVIIILNISSYSLLI